MDKNKIYGESTMRQSAKPSVKTITMGNTEHVVMSPQEMQRFQREFTQLHRQVKQLQAELVSVKAQIRVLHNKPTPPAPAPNPWGANGGNGGY